MSLKEQAIAELERIRRDKSAADTRLPDKTAQWIVDQCEEHEKLVLKIIALFEEDGEA